MSQEIWHPLLIGPFLWLVGIAGMGSVAYVLLKWSGVEERRKELSWTLFVSMVLATILVIADLSRSWNLIPALWSAIAGGTFNVMGSWMSVGIVLLILGILFTLLLAIRNTGVKQLSAVVDTRGFESVMILLGVLLTIYSGFLIATTPGIPFWNTALIPLLWMISSSKSAVSLVKVLIYNESVSKSATKYGLGLSVTELISLFALINLAMYGSRAAKLSAETLAYGGLAIVFWVGVIILGILLPLFMGLVKKKGKVLGIAATVLSLMGA
ncbi:MAG: NrfD/PsrC family molybdoenzyme membrane anchor subunit, partial [Nitrososphaerota archaeon]|nr:polysulfide reductase NrfD [Nitrososphaerales archaeon]MDW8045307.1 NrfD/PsrC family molybdoenzyme membrane anchor subunit [Nitrososphaerota archaeon]